MLFRTAFISNFVFVEASYIIEHRSAEMSLRPVLTPLRSVNVPLPESLGLDPNTISEPDPQYWSDLLTPGGEVSSELENRQEAPRNAQHESYYPPYYYPNSHGYNPPPGYYPPRPRHPPPPSHGYHPLHRGYQQQQGYHTLEPRSLFSQTITGAFAFAGEIPLTSTPLPVPNTTSRLNEEGILTGVLFLHVLSYKIIFLIK
jgi:hypothetical protein